MKRVQIQFTDEQVQTLKRLAAERGVSTAMVVREAVGSYLAGATPEARVRAVEAIGGFRSGLHDVGERHDDYLTEDFA